MKRILILVFILGFTTTAWATDWDLYGHVRLGLGNYDLSEDKSSGPSNDTTISGDGVNDDGGTALYMETISRVGATVSLPDGVGGGWELGYGSANGIYTRLFYGSFQLGGATILAGQHYTPINVFYSNSVADDGFWGSDNLLQTGMIYDGRRIMLQVAMAGFTAALIESNTTTIGAYTDVDSTIPKLEVAYSYSNDTFEVKPYLGYQTYTVKTPGASQQSIDIASSVLGAAAKVKFGKANVGVNVYSATNGGNFGIYHGLAGGMDMAQLNAAGTDVEDSSQIGAAIHVGVDLSEKISLGAGYGMVQSEVEGMVTAGVDTEQTVSQFYLNAPIKINDHVSLIPEIGQFDDGDLETGSVSVEQGTSTYYMFLLTISF